MHVWRYISIYLGSKYLYCAILLWHSCRTKYLCYERDREYHGHSDSIKKISGNENQNKIKLINEAEATDGHNPFNTKSLNDDDFAFINDSMKSDMTYDREEGFKIQKSAEVPFELPFP